MRLLINHKINIILPILNNLINKKKIMKNFFFQNKKFYF